MRLSVFLILLFFMRATATTSITRAWIVGNGEQVKEIPYDLNYAVNHKEAYILTRGERLHGFIIFLVGAQSKPYRKVVVAKSATHYLKAVYESVPRGYNLYFNRIICDTKIKKFADLPPWGQQVFESPPRLYRVGTHAVVQIQINPELINNVDAFVLKDGFIVNVYYPSSINTKKRNVAKLFAEYIATFEYGKHYANIFIFEIDNDKKKSRTASDKFFQRIKEIMESLSQNDMGNAKTINEEFKAKINISYDKDFENIRKMVIKYIQDNMFPRATDAFIYGKIFNAVMASTSSAPPTFAPSTFEHSTSAPFASTASSFTDSTKNNEAVKHKTRQKGKKSLSRTNDSRKVPTTSTATSSMDQYAIPVIILGPPECRSEGTGRVESMKSTCVYVIIELQTYDLFIYFGRDGEKSDFEMAITIAEVFLNINQSAKVSYIVDDGNVTHPSIMIHFESEIKKYLNISSRE